jgi:polysaccharide biosynthesis protein PslH
LKLLIVSPSFPSPGWGGGNRNLHLLKMLALKHTISLLAQVSEHDRETYNTSLLENYAQHIQIIACRFAGVKRVRQVISLLLQRSYTLNAFIAPEMQKALDTLLIQDHYDAVLFESVQTAGYHVPDGLKIIIDQHNIEHELLWRAYQGEKGWLRRWYNRLESHLTRTVEIERCRRADIVLVTSERERLLLKSLLPKSVIEVVPNGVDVEVFQNDSWQKEVAGQIIFTGTFSYYPNINAVLFFARRCWPLIRKQIPAATWQIVGSNPPSKVQRLAELPGVTVTGTVPDVRPHLAAAEVAIAPILIGGGTRLKILEALSMQKAVVSTSLGCEGLAVVPGEHLVVEDQPEEFAQAVVTFLKNAEMRQAFGTAGRALVEARYSWDDSGERLLQALDEHN